MLNINTNGHEGNTCMSITISPCVVLQIHSSIIMNFWYGEVNLMVPTGVPYNQVSL